MKKLFISFFSFVFILLLGLNGTSYAQYDEQASNPSDTIKRLIEFENEQKWESISGLWSDDMKGTISEFLSNPENMKQHTGLFNIKKASLVAQKQIPEEYKDLFPNMSESSLLYYIAVNYEVFEEDVFHMNGINYFLVELVKENNNWNIKQLQNAPVDILQNSKLGFNTADENAMIEIISKRHKGNYLNRSNTTLEINRLSEDELINTRGEKPLTKEDLAEKIGLNKTELSSESLGSIASTSDHVLPSNISVYMTSSVNKSGHGCSANCVRAVNFKTSYVENVLPNEWRIEWPSNSLMTGALAVKMYGWYGVYYPLASAVGAHVYDDTRSQVYLYGSSNSKTDKAIQDVNGIGIHRQDNNALFLTEYAAGTSGSPGTQSSGKVSQWGSKYLADQGQLPYQILSYYYNGSSKVGGSGKVLQFFSY